MPTRLSPRAKEKFAIDEGQGLSHRQPDWLNYLRGERFGWTTALAQPESLDHHDPAPANHEPGPPYPAAFAQTLEGNSAE